MAHRLRDLGPQHHAAVRMRIEGVPSDEICERLGIERRTLYLWFGDPLVKAELTRQLARVDELFAGQLETSMGGRASRGGQPCTSLSASADAA